MKSSFNERCEDQEQQQQRRREVVPPLGPNRIVETLNSVQNAAWDLMVPLPFTWESIDRYYLESIIFIALQSFWRGFTGFFFSSLYQAARVMEKLSKLKPFQQQQQGRRRKSCLNNKQWICCFSSPDFGAPFLATNSRSKLWNVPNETCYQRVTQAKVDNLARERGKAPGQGPRWPSKREWWLMDSVRIVHFEFGYFTHTHTHNNSMSNHWSWSLASRQFACRTSKRIWPSKSTFNVSSPPPSFPKLFFDWTNLSSF